MEQESDSLAADIPEFKNEKSGSIIKEKDENFLGVNNEQ